MTSPPGPNPYEPPGSDYKQGAQREATDTPRATRAVRRLAVLSGLLFLVASLSTERLLRWQAGNLLREYSAEHHIETMVAAQMARYGNSIFITAILASLVIAGGVLTSYRPAYGLRLLMLASALFVGHVVLDLARSGTVPEMGLILRCAWWAFMFYMAFIAHRRLAG